MAQTMHEANDFIDKLIERNIELGLERDTYNILAQKCVDSVNKIELDPILIVANTEKRNVEHVVPPSNKPTPKHAFTLLSGVTLEEERDNVGSLISERIKPVVGLVYMYFVTEDVGLGVMGYSNKTVSLTFTLRF